MTDVSPDVTPEVTPASPRLTTHSFSHRHHNTIVHFQVLRLSGSFLLWLSDTPCFKQLAVAMPSPLASGLPVASLLLNKAGQGGSDQLAAKLARRTGKQVFVSCNLNLAEDAELRRAVEARVVEEMSEQPDMF